MEELFFERSDPQNSFPSSDSINEHASDNSNVDLESLKKSIIDAIKSELKSEELTNELSLKIANVVSEKLKTVRDSSENVKENPSIWKTGESYMYCESCCKYKNSDKVPASLKKLKKGMFGYVKLNQSTDHLNRSIKAHEINELHNWCCAKQIEVENDQCQFDEKNKEAGRIVIRNGLFCLKNSLSSLDF